ncbi:RING finger and CHY zinc finger domain-containing protein 1 [Amphibalanus amphitrite]|uniref:RING finger and CHY zinc finger domain-containing protein 1 n=1 Tax=Amphibalanus amphitrite TaxID=1232801 RepID=A0A6A4WM30_AMPAM|nr:RING finger and CHY zinc finger domain-containing protein 1 [Amphibalanus amphitrite]
MADVHSVNSSTAQTDVQQQLGCEHYRRKARLVAPCCGRLYWCRLCHDAAEVHTLNRFEVTEIQCGACDLRQGVSGACERCGVQFGEYFCSICRLYDKSRDQYHCEECGLCRVGPREKTFHCAQCGSCYPLSERQSHQCRPAAALDDCAVCLDDLHSSRAAVHVNRCGHSLHEACRQQMLQHGLFSCPLCNVSMLEMQPVWRELDKAVQQTAMPSQYRHLLASVLCRDCQATSVAPFHVVGLKCAQCGSYNTARSGGPMYRRGNGGELLPATDETRHDEQVI